MTAPAGVSSGSAPEPIAGTTADPQAAGAEGAESALAAAVPPQATEPVITAAEPAQATAVPPKAVAVPPQAAEPVLTEAGPAQATAVPPQAVAVPPQAAEPVLTEAGPAQAAVEPTGEPRDESAVGEPRGENVPSTPDEGPGPAAEEPAGPAGRRRDVRLFAVAASVVGILALVGAAVAILAVVTHGFRPKTVVTYRAAAVFSLRAGECINSSPNGQSATIRSCATPHDAEVFATFRLTGSSWPGSAVVQQEASNGCVSRAAAYMNPQLADAGFTQEYVFPDQQAWKAGVRTVVCEIRASSGQLTGSVRAAG